MQLYMEDVAVSAMNGAEGADVTCEGQAAIHGHGLASLVSFEVAA